MYVNFFFKVLFLHIYILLLTVVRILCKNVWDHSNEELLTFSVFCVISKYESIEEKYWGTQS